LTVVCNDYYKAIMFSPEKKIPKQKSTKYTESDASFNSEEEESFRVSTHGRGGRAKKAPKNIKKFSEAVVSGRWSEREQ
jgi:hypothetical protein